MSHLTTAQLGVLKTYINSVPALASKPLTSAGNGEIATELNKAASPDFYVWRPLVTEKECMSDVVFAWSRVDNLSVGKARIWEWLFKFGSIDASQSNVRAGITACWTGTQADTDVQTAVLAKCKRLATQFEKLLATGTGSVGSPAVMAAEGPVTADHVAEARELP